MRQYVDDRSLVDVLDFWLDNRLRNIHTILPGKIEQYYGHTERKAKVKPLVKLKTNNNKDIAIDPIDNVPVIFPSNSSFNFLYPLSRGDGVLLLFSESPIGNFLNSTEEQASDDLERFSLTDCIAIPGLWSFRSVPSTAQIKFEVDSQNAITIQTSTGTIKIESSGAITFDNGTEAFVLGTTLQTMLSTLCTTIATATSGSTVQNAAGIETIKAAFATFAGQLGTMLSTQIKGL